MTLANGFAQICHHHEMIDGRLRLDLTADDAALGEAGGLMDVAARLPANLGQAMLDGQSAPGPGGNRPVQFVDVMPKTSDQRVR